MQATILAASLFQSIPDEEEGERMSPSSAPREALLALPDGQVITCTTATTPKISKTHLLGLAILLRERLCNCRPLPGRATHVLKFLLTSRGEGGVQTHNHFKIASGGRCIEM